MRAYLKNYRQSPQKVRLITDLVKGKSVSEALLTLRYSPQRATQAVAKLINSAAANAHHNDSADPANLMISDIRVDEGYTLKRFRARARGRGARVRKRTSHITVELAQNLADKAVTKKASKTKAAKS
jgi:large subunit ribosomal protein L22